jgi:hypothetical protein
MTAPTDATPTSLLLIHIKDSTVILTTIHDPSLLLPFYCIGSAITTALNAPSLLLLYVLDDPAIMMATHAIYPLQLIVESFSTEAKQVAPATFCNN